MSSFKPHNEILLSTYALPSKWIFRGYLFAFEISPLLIFLRNSIIIASISTFLNVFIVGMGAYVFARFNFKGKNILFSVLSLSIMLPMASVMFPIFLVITRLNLYDSHIGLILVYTALGLPFSLYILRSYFLSIPRQIEEAAIIDGASFYRIYLQIMLPLAKPGIATACILQFLFAWNEFAYALILTSSNDVRTAPVAIAYFTSAFTANYTAMFAAIVALVGPTIIAFVIFSKYVIKGLSEGAVKQ